MEGSINPNSWRRSFWRMKHCEYFFFMGQPPPGRRVCDGWGDLRRPRPLPYKVPGATCCHSPGTWERHQLLCQASVTPTVRMLPQTRDPLSPRLIKGSAATPLMRPRPGSVRRLSAPPSLAGFRVRCRRLLCPCRCGRISIKSKLQNWRTANLISKAISD